MDFESDFEVQVKKREREREEGERECHDQLNVSID